MMKKSVFVFLFLILSVSSVFAQYKRKLKEPDFFIPYEDRMHKPEILPKIKKIVKTTNKTENTNNKSEEKTEEKKFSVIPYYKKIYDDYLNKMNTFITTKDFTDENLDADLNVMESGNVFEVVDDNTSAIDSQEQYDFYMLARDLLKN